MSNQRTNGPVNAHLISGPTVSTKRSKIGQGQPRVIIYIDIVELESPMLSAKFQDHRTSGSGEEVFFFLKKYHIWAWWPSWSCDLYHLYKLSFPLPRETLYKIWASLAELFQRRCLKIIIIYMYIAPEQGQITPWGQISFIDNIIQ